MKESNLTEMCGWELAGFQRVNPQSTGKTAVTDGKTAVTDNLRKLPTQDCAHISMSREYEVDYWTRVLGVSKKQLAAIVARVGNSPNAVRLELNK
jgi:hypothetical protein